MGVTAAAPNIRFGNDISDPGLMYETLKAVFIAPMMMKPDVSVLVLGAWGCGAFGGDPEQISELFARILQQDKLGNLYHEVHFAIPPDRVNAKTFRKTFAKRGIKLT